MQEDAAHRARQRADEARQRAREAGARAAELASGPGTFDATSLARSKQAVERAAHLAAEGYRHAAEAELSAARTHDSIAESLEKRCEQDPAHSEQLRQQAADPPGLGRRPPPQGAVRRVLPGADRPTVPTRRGPVTDPRRPRGFPAAPAGRHRRP